ncbi:MAG: hypothetical protein HN909_02680 [Phycisphaerales bacterium]|jgi:hypothetical protein|nr:hypothetical protein [Phycisphaerales bacterium]MBT7170657.1 hypothetical protein [Phycisphaerales bacterium]
MTSYLKSLAAFLGTVLAAIAAKLIPALGREIRRNHTVQQKGNDHETNATLDQEIWTTASQARNSSATTEASAPTNHDANLASGATSSSAGAGRRLRDVPPDDHAAS